MGYKAGFIGGLLLCIFACQTAWATNEDQNINRIYRTIQVSRDVSLSPLWMCHNGLYLFFREKNFCEKAQIDNFDCELNREIAPIRSAEKISTEEGGDSIMRFFHIDLRYNYQEVNRSTGELLTYEERSVPECKNRKVYESENVTSQRVVRTDEERYFVQSLVDQSKMTQDLSFLIVNSPIGNVDSLENLTIEDYGKSDDQFQMEAMVKTPFCSNMESDEVWKLSGEYTGSGVRELHPSSLQMNSQPFYIQKQLLVFNEKTGEMEPRYIFTCRKTWDI